MNLKEYQGKQYFKKYGIKVPESFLVKRGEKVPEINFNQVVIKGQTLTGSRKKSGLIKFSNKSNLQNSIEELFKKNLDEILIEEKIDIKKEFYLSVTIDIFSNNIVCLFSEKGGIDIEDVDKDKIIKFFVSDIDRINFDNDKIKTIIKSLYKLMKDIDAELVEINPLALADNDFVALDSKIIVDDNSLFRQQELSKIKESQLEGIERDAFFKGIEYVELEGDVGVIGNGAGLVMSTLDTLKFSGVNPANFLDVGGGANSEKMISSLNLLMEKNPKKILINIFGGITRCDEIAKGIVKYKVKHGLNVPIFVRLTGSKSEEAKKILEDNGIKYFETLQEAIKSMVEKNV